MNIQRNYKRFKDELRNSILLVSISLVVVFSLLFYVFINVIGLYIMSTTNQKVNNYVSERVNEQILMYEDYIVEVFEPQLSTRILDVVDGRQTLFEELYRFIDQQEIHSLFYVFDHQGELLLTNSYAQNPYDIEYKFLSGIFRQMDANNEQVVMRVNKQQLSNNLRTLYSIGKSIMVDEEVIGYLVFDIIESQLNFLIQENPVDILVITDRYQNSIISTDTTVLNPIAKFEPEIEDERYTTSIRNQRHYIHVNNVANQRIKVYTLSSMQFLNSLFYTGLAVQLFVVILSIIVLFSIADRFSNKNTQSLDELLNAIDEVKQGNLNVNLDIQTYDEFNKVSVYFNEMLSNVKSLIAENNELNTRNNLSEIKQLESQFNPHFLFNALESLKYLIRMNTQEAEKFTLSLARLLRYSIEFGQQFVTLEKDIKYIRDYLKISQFRHGKRLSFDIDVSERSKEAIIPKLMIQPLIENSLNHGYTQQDMKIEIISKVEDNQLIISVIDNGIGFNKERLQEINDLLNSEHNESEHIGLYNVHRRIMLQYGKQYGLRIDSIKNQTTKIDIILPFQSKEEKK